MPYRLSVGRPLLASDEVEGASPVVVLGYREWTTRFARDPDVVGTQVPIGRDRHTIVGVMPDGFTFPFSSRFWIPLRDDADDFPILAALKARCFYIGALGSRKTHGKRVERLLNQGAGADEIARIHAPIGIDIGAQSPAEIAVAIQAEIIAALRRGPSAERIAA